mmetsp:Transcript_15972/g.48123  ORF Transcript_15972/g.48123 Transcript_15972/m.48123 type:complete len:276 (+) Transcript_15972:318-1145(+)
MGGAPRGSGWAPLLNIWKTKLCCTFHTWTASSQPDSRASSSFRRCGSHRRHPEKWQRKRLCLATTWAAAEVPQRPSGACRIASARTTEIIRGGPPPARVLTGRPFHPHGGWGLRGGRRGTRLIALWGRQRTRARLRLGGLVPRATARQTGHRRASRPSSRTPPAGPARASRSSEAPGPPRRRSASRPPRGLLCGTTPGLRQRSSPGAQLSSRCCCGGRPSTRISAPGRTASLSISRPHASRRAHMSPPPSRATSCPCASTSPCPWRRSASATRRR